jgi:hypothetical protein
MSSDSDSTSNFTQLITKTTRCFMLRDTKCDFHFDRVVENVAGNEIRNRMPIEIIHSIKLINWEHVKAFYVVCVEGNDNDEIHVRNGRILHNVSNATILLMYTQEMLEIQHKINNDLASYVTIHTACDIYIPVMFSGANKKIIYYIEKKPTALDSIVTLFRKYATVLDQSLNTYLLEKNMYVLSKQSIDKQELINSRNTLININCDDNICGLIISIKKSEMSEEVMNNMHLSANIHYRSEITQQMGVKQFALTEMSKDNDLHMFSMDDYYLFQIELNSTILDFFNTNDAYGMKLSDESSINVCFNMDIVPFNIKIIHLIQKKIVYCRNRLSGIQQNNLLVLNRDYAVPRNNESINLANILERMMSSSINEFDLQILMNDPTTPTTQVTNEASIETSVIPNNEQNTTDMVEISDPDNDSGENSNNEVLPQTPETPPGVNVAYPSDMPPEIRRIFSNLFERGLSENGVSGRVSGGIIPMNLFGSTPQSEQNINSKRFNLTQYLELHSETLIRMIKSYEMKHATKSMQKVECSVEMRNIKVGEYYYKCIDQNYDDIINTDREKFKGCGKCISEDVCIDWFYKSGKNTCPTCRHVYKKCLPPMYLRIEKPKKLIKTNKLTKRIKFIDTLTQLRKKDKCVKKTDS